MARTRTLLVPVLVGLLVAVLLGPARVTALEPRTVTASIMIPAAAFIPTTNGFDYANTGTTLEVADEGILVARVPFPVRQVTVRKITLYASDSGATDLIQVSLARSRPAAFTQDLMGTVHTEDSGVQAVSTAAISPRKVDNATQAAVLGVWIGGDAVVLVVKITYSYDPGA